jgi:hypothetical protein
MNKLSLSERMYLNLKKTPLVILILLGIAIICLFVMMIIFFLYNRTSTYDWPLSIKYLIWISQIVFWICFFLTFILMSGKPSWLTNPLSKKIPPKSGPSHLYVPGPAKVNTHNYLGKFSIGPVIGELHYLKSSESSMLLYGVLDPKNIPKYDYYIACFGISKGYGKIFIVDAELNRCFGLFTTLFNKALPVYSDNEYESNQFNGRYIVYTQDSKIGYAFFNPKVIHVFNQCQMRMFGLEVAGQTIRIFFRGKSNQENSLDNLKEFARKVYEAID